MSQREDGVVMGQCRGITKEGNRCRRRVGSDTSYCSAHKNETEGLDSGAAIVGAAGGFLVGGPLGALAGAVVGPVVREFFREESPARPVRLATSASSAQSCESTGRPEYKARQGKKPVTQTHRVFISYHHANDENYKNIFELRFGNRFLAVVPGSVRIGDIDPDLKAETIRQKIRDAYLRKTSVTVVLIGKATWQRKHVDWEISSSIRNSQANPRSGLVGLFLPSHSDFHCDNYTPGTLPPRLHDNVACKYALLADWSEDPQVIQDLVHHAYLRKSTAQPHNSRDLFKNNRSGHHWQD